MRKWTGPRKEDCDSSYCIEVAPGDDPNNLFMRSNTLKQFKILVTREEFAAFIASAKAGHYDGMAAGS